MRPYKSVVHFRWLDVAGKYHLQSPTNTRCVRPRDRPEITANTRSAAHDALRHGNAVRAHAVRPYKSAVHFGWLMLLANTIYNRQQILAASVGACCTRPRDRTGATANRRSAAHDAWRNGYAERAHAMRPYKSAVQFGWLDVAGKHHLQSPTNTSCTRPRDRTGVRANMRFAAHLV